ncbi:MAG: FAD:protein FMN transferase [Paracoccaceae bacterium]
MISRRRFISIIAASATISAAGKAPIRWRGRALGAEARVELHDLPESALDDIPKILAKIEDLFSLYAPNSTLTQLNTNKHAPNPPTEFDQLLDAIDRIYHATQGRFDPTIQTLWRALAERRDPSAAFASIGWQRVSRGAGGIRIGSDQELSFNGIAQGFATDLIAAHLHSQGAEKTLVDIGEISAIGGPFRIGLSDPKLGMHGWRSLQSAALATSSPGAMLLSEADGHILDPKGQTKPLWSSVTLEAANATLADGFSTAFCLTPLTEIQSILTKTKELHRATLVSKAQEVITLT